MQANSLRTEDCNSIYSEFQPWNLSLIGLKEGKFSRFLQPSDWIGVSPVREPTRQEKIELRGRWGPRIDSGRAKRQKRITSHFPEALLKPLVG
jgi:hypothetical protein